MFHHLTEFGYVRTVKEAVGFYLAYLLLAVLFSALLGGVFSAFTSAQTFDEGFRVGMKVGQIFVTFFAMGLSILVLQARDLLKNFGYLLLVAVTGILTFLVGGFLGLAVIAYLTTRPGREGNPQATIGSV